MSFVYSMLIGSMLAAEPPPAVELEYVHSLATTSGVLPLSGASLAWEPTHGELFVTGNGLVRIFNEAGMQTYEFGEDPGVGGILTAVPLENGDLIALSFLDGKPSLLRVNFRGEPVARMSLELPEGAEFEGFTPSVLRHSQGKLYLADTARMKVVVADTKGALVTTFDLAELLQVQDEKADTGIRGFNVDSEGNLLLTIQALFRAWVVTPQGSVRSFGQRGSTPGKFNVVGGIASDEAGNLYVADILRSVVMVFRSDFRFVREFGYRGQGTGNLAGPDELVVANGRLYVANNSRRGVSVFKVIQK